MPRTRPYRQLYFWVLIGMIAGILVGYHAPASAPLKFSLFGSAFAFAGTDLKPLSDAFIRMIRMMITPIIFTTVVVGICRMGSLHSLGRIGLKAFIYFQVMTTLALILGWVVADVVKPGAAMNVDVAALNVKDIQHTLSAAQQPHGFVPFLLNIIPETLVSAFAKGDILQALFISVLFGVALASIGAANERVVLALEQVTKALMKMIGFVIKLAPFAVFGAMSFTISKWGLESLVHQAKIVGCVWATCFGFVVVALGALLGACGVNLFKLLRYLREELFIVFGTASSESVFPRLMNKLEHLGCARSHVGLALPAGYSFNLQGSCIFLTMGAFFIAQATNTAVSFGQQFGLFLLCLITSKSAATVVGSAFIVLAATLSSYKTIPVEGMVLILGVDWLLAQARAMTNMVGNSVATIVISKWERAFDLQRARQVLNGGAAEVVPVAIGERAVPNAAVAPSVVR